MNVVRDRAAALRAVVRREDAVVAAWALVAVPLLAATAGGDAAFELGGDHPPAVGLVFLVAAVGAIGCLLTRGRGEPVPDPAALLTPGTYARFPFTVAVGVIGGEGAASLGLPGGDAFLGLALVAAVVGLVVPGRLPVIEPAARRALVTPVILIGTSAFELFAADLWAGITPGEIVAGLEGAEASFVAFFLTLLAAGTLAFWVMLVYAPRQVADPEGSWAAWAVRFVLFLTSVVLGVGWLRLFA